MEKHPDKIFPVLLSERTFLEEIPKNHELDLELQRLHSRILQMEQSFDASRGLKPKRATQAIADKFELIFKEKEKKVKTEVQRPSSPKLKLDLARVRKLRTSGLLPADFKSVANVEALKELCRKWNLDGFAKFKRRAEIEAFMWHQALQKFVGFDSLIDEDLKVLADNLQISSVKKSHSKQNKKESILHWNGPQVVESSFRGKKRSHGSVLPLETSKKKKIVF